MEYNNEIRDVLNTYKNALLSGTITEELAENTGCPKHLHRLFMEIADSIHTDDMRRAELKEEYNALLEQVGELSAPPTDIVVHLDPSKIDLDLLKAGQQAILVPVKPVNLEWWREQKGKTLHHTEFKIGDIVEVVNMKVTAPVKSIMVNIMEEGTRIHYVLNGYGICEENQLKKVEIND